MPAGIPYYRGTASIAYRFRERGTTTWSAVTWVPATQPALNQVRAIVSRDGVQIPVGALLGGDVLDVTAGGIYEMQWRGAHRRVFIDWDNPGEGATAVFNYSFLAV